MQSRRNFIRTSAGLSGAFLFSGLQSDAVLAGGQAAVEVDGHLWVYASRFPPHWDGTPALDEAFADLKAAGFARIELMEAILKHKGSVQRLLDLSGKHKLPVIGTSYYGDMWDKEQQQHIVADVELVLERLHAVGGSMIGLTVGDANRIKTEAELDTQAETLQKVIGICKKYEVLPNLHNHTFEVTNNLHDLKGTLQRIPDIKLGPDLNWLIRGGVDPVWFIKTYGHQLVYLHIRDQDKNGKWTEAVGEGVTDFGAIATALNEIGYSGRAAVELAFEGPPKNAVSDNWKKSRQYVKKVFGW